MSTKEEIVAFMADVFPDSMMTVVEVGQRGSTLRQEIGPAQLRPGGTVSGPVMMALVDAALYVAIFGELGLVALAVTTNYNFNFLRKPSADKNVIGICHLLKVGKTLVVGEVTLYSEGDDEPIAHAVGTYSIPPQR